MKVNCKVMTTLTKQKPVNSEIFMTKETVSKVCLLNCFHSNDWHLMHDRVT